MGLKPRWTSVLWATLIVGQILMYASYSILVNLSKIDGIVPYHTSLLVFTTELCKMCLCVVLVAAQYLHSPEKHRLFPSVGLDGVMLYSIPALCYTFNNNIAVFMQTQMDPATYMVLGNFKILTTGVLYQLIMKKCMSIIQWFSLGLLTVGAISSSVAAVSSSVQSLSEIHCTWLGLLSMVVYCLVSGFAGVFMEYQFKKITVLSLLHQNILLYAFGLVLNFSLLMLQDFWQDGKHAKVTADSTSLLPSMKEFTVAAWMIVITQTAVGLIMSLIVKYRSNMTRVFIISSAPLVTTFLSCVVFQLRLQPMFIAAVICVVIATAMYNLSPQVVFTKDYKTSINASIKENVLYVSGK